MKQDRVVNVQDQKDSRIFQSNLLETQIHQQYSNNKIKITTTNGNN